MMYLTVDHDRNEAVDESESKELRRQLFTVGYNYCTSGTYLIENLRSVPNLKHFRSETLRKLYCLKGQKV